MEYSILNFSFASQGTEVYLYNVGSAQPHTTADLDWINKQSRRSVEIKDLRRKRNTPFATS